MGECIGYILAAALFFTWVFCNTAYTMGYQSAEQDYLYSPEHFDKFAHDELKAQHISPKYIETTR